MMDIEEKLDSGIQKNPCGKLIIRNVLIVLNPWIKNLLN